MKKFLMNLIAPILVAAFVAGGVNAQVWRWSINAANNGNADPTIDFSEGMAPSSVNDSARALMARVADYRDDISGKLVTGGTSTAYTLITNSGLNAVPDNGQLIAFTMHATNGVGSTLRVDGGNVYPIRTDSSTAIAVGSLGIGAVYTAKFDLAAGAWILREFYSQPLSVPLGAMLPYTGSTVPNANFVIPYGQCISRTVYASYFAMVGTSFGACDGVLNFAVPDSRGRTIAGLDNLGGTPANRLTPTYFGASSTTMGGAGGAESQTLLITQIPSHSHGVTDPGHSHSIPGGVPGGGFATISFDSVGLNAAWPSANAVTGISIQNTGGGNPHPNVQPTMVLSYILRVL